MKNSLFIILGILLVCIGTYSSIEPQLDRDWAEDQALLAHAEIGEEIVRIQNVRNFSYITASNYTQDYYHKTYNLSTLHKMYYLVEPFSDFDGAAHTFFTFEFENDTVAISAEIRKEKNETYSALAGLFKQYELVYIIGDEEDLIKLRTNYRKDSVYMYPVNASQEQIRTIFIDMLERNNKLAEDPEFYNTLTNTCTTNLVSHVNRLAPGSVGYNYQVLFPGYSGKLAYEKGLILRKGTFEETREYYNITQKAWASNTTFSEDIRAQQNI